MKYQIVLIAVNPKDGEIRGKVIIAERPTMEAINELNSLMLKQRTLPIEQCIPEVKFVKAIQELINEQHGETAFALERIGLP